MADETKRGLDALEFLVQISDGVKARDLNTGNTVSLLGGEVTSAGALALAEAFAGCVRDAYSELEGLCAKSGDDPSSQSGYQKLLEMARNGEQAARRNPTNVPGFLASIYGRAEAEYPGVELARCCLGSLNIALQERDGIRGRIAQMGTTGLAGKDPSDEVTSANDAQWDAMLSEAEARQCQGSPDDMPAGTTPAESAHPSPSLVSSGRVSEVVEYGSGEADSEGERSGAEPPDDGAQAVPTRGVVPQPSPSQASNPAALMNFPGLARRKPQAAPAGHSEAAPADGAQANEDRSSAEPDMTPAPAAAAREDEGAMPGDEEGLAQAFGYDDGGAGDDDTIVIDSAGADDLPDEPAPVMGDEDVDADRLLVRTVLRMALSRAQESIGMDSALDVDQYADLYGIGHDVDAVRAHLLARVAAYARLGRI